jgi:4-amino-4-deoxy-L-arabinose transferase-like glycosyltransferase
MDSHALSPHLVKRWFVGALLVAAAVRGYLLWQYYCISSDGVTYLRAAEDFYTGDFMAGLSSLYPPGYPVLIAAVYPLIGDWELAGQSLSLLFGVTLLFPLYWLFRQVFGDRIALLGCYLASVSPFLALYSVHVRSESTYLFLSAVTLALFATALARKSFARFFLGGIVAGYAYLVRPEAIGFLVIVSVVLLIHVWRREIRFIWSIQSVGAMTLGFLLLALPFIVYLSIDTGRFGAISRKAGLTLALNLKKSGMLEDDVDSHNVDVNSFSFTDYLLRHPLIYAKKVATDVPAAIAVFFEALHYSYLPFFLLGVFLITRRGDWLGTQLLLIGTVLFYVVGFALIYVKRRYSLQAVPISLAWVALAMWWAWERLKLALPARTVQLIALSVLIVFLGATLPKTLRAVSREKAYVREAGWYLKARNKDGALRVAALDDRVTFYAGAKTIPLEKIEASQFANYLREQRVVYFAAESKIFAQVLPEVSRQPEAFGLTLEKSFIGTRNDRMLLFKVT